MGYPYRFLYDLLNKPLNSYNLENKGDDFEAIENAGVMAPLENWGGTIRRLVDSVWPYS
jgi:hypothetical protein